MQLVIQIMIGLVLLMIDVLHLDTLIFVGGYLVVWTAKKQSVVAHLSAEGEYRAMTNATYELIWMKQLMKELGYPTQASILLYCCIVTIRLKV